MKKVLLLSITTLLFITSGQEAISASPPPEARSVPAHPQSVWRVQNPIVGHAGKYEDSNVPAVWLGVPHKVRQTWLCIRRHESMRYDSYNHGGHSSSSGAGQWIDSTWHGLAHWVKVNGKFVARGYKRAAHAPAWVQDAAYLHVFHHGGMHMWVGTHCPGTG